MAAYAEATYVTEDNEMWIVIDDSAVMGGTYLTFYTDNPDTNPNAPIAEQVTLG